MARANARGQVGVTVDAEHRDGICEKCGKRIVVVDEGDEDTPMRRECEGCGGSIGRLIARSVSIQGPPPPTCTRPKCIWQFFRDSLYVALLSTYHSRRVRYAEKKRHKKIPMKYRTGEDAPKDIKGAVLALIKLKLRR